MADTNQMNRSQTVTVSSRDTWMALEEHVADGWGSLLVGRAPCTTHSVPRPRFPADGVSSAHVRGSVPLPSASAGYTCCAGPLGIVTRQPGLGPALGLSSDPGRIERESGVAVHLGTRFRIQGLRKEVALVLPMPFLCFQLGIKWANSRRGSICWRWCRRSWARRAEVRSLPGPPVG